MEGALRVMRNQAGVMMPDVNEDFVAIAKAEGWYSDELMERIAKTGSVNHAEVPVRWQQVFNTANNISPEYHIRMQAAFQQHRRLAGALLKARRYPETVEASVGAIAIMDSVMGDRRPASRQARENLLAAYVALGDSAAARRLRTELAGMKP